MGYVASELGPEAVAMAPVTSDNVGKQVDTTGGVVETPPVPPLAMTAQQFKTLRRVSGLTMAETARTLGVSERTVLRWEHGVTHIDALKAQAIREELRASWERLENPTGCRDEGEEDDGASET